MSHIRQRFSHGMGWRRNVVVWSGGAKVSADSYGLGSIVRFRRKKMEPSGIRSQFIGLKGEVKSTFDIRRLTGKINQPTMIPELELLCDKLKSRVESKRISLEFPSESSLNVVPATPDTFPIMVSFENGQFEVAAAKWRAEFDQLDQASAAICWLLTPYYRIVRSVQTGSDIATWIEIYTNEGWEATRTIYFVNPSTLQSPIDDADEIVILQQAVFLDSAFETYYPAAHLDEARYPVGTILGETTYSNHSGDWAPVGVPIAE